MIIRSQDKKCFVNMDNISNIYIAKPLGELSFRISASGYVLATYSTEEKAIKVLDMIQNAYTQYGTIKDGLGNIHNAFNLPKVFQMPQDSEV